MAKKLGCASCGGTMKKMKAGGDEPTKSETTELDSEVRYWQYSE
jgi:hypothetical protein